MDIKQSQVQISVLVYFNFIQQLWLWIMW